MHHREKCHGKNTPLIYAPGKCPLPQFQNFDQPAKNPGSAPILCLCVAGFLSVRSRGTKSKSASCSRACACKSR